MAPGRDGAGPGRRARIGGGTLVAAGAVVRPGTVVPAGVLVAGVPGRVVRELTSSDKKALVDTATPYVDRAGPSSHCGLDRACLTSRANLPSDPVNMAVDS
jgi:hypothetical protein